MTVDVRYERTEHNSTAADALSPALHEAASVLQQMCTAEGDPTGFRLDAIEPGVIEADGLLLWRFRFSALQQYRQ
jgi:hypothetical protein